MERKMPKKRNRKKRKSAKVGFVLVFLLIFAITFFVLLKTVLFPITTINVKNNSVHKAEDIIFSSLVTEKDKLFAVSQKKVKEKIIEKLPLIKDVKLIRELPGTLTIAVTPDKEAYNFKINKNYLLVTENYKLIKTLKKPNFNCITVVGTEVKPTEIGSEINFLNQEKKEEFLNLQKYLVNAKLKISKIDVTDSLELKATINKKITVNFGTIKDIDYKISHLKGMLKNIDINLKGNIDLKGWTSENPKGYYTNS